MKVKIIVSMILLLPVILLGCASTVSETSQPIEPLTPEQGIVNIVNQELGKSNREGVVKFQGQEVSQDGANYVISLRFAIDDNLSESWIKQGAENDVFNVMKALYQSDYPIQEIHMFGSFSMKDKYGNLSEDSVLTSSLTKTTEQKINWDNLYADELFEILDTLTWHPAFLAID